MFAALLMELWRAPMAVINHQARTWSDEGEGDNDADDHGHNDRRAHQVCVGLNASSSWDDHNDHTSPCYVEVIIDGFVWLLAFLFGITDRHHIPRRVGGACVRFNGKTAHALPSTPLAQVVLGNVAHSR